MVCLFQSLYHSFPLKGWELLIVPLSFDLLFLVGVFVLCGCCVFKYWHLFNALTLINSFGAVQKVGGRGIKIPPELLCMYWLIIAGVLCCGWI